MTELRHEFRLRDCRIFCFLFWKRKLLKLNAQLPDLNAILILNLRRFWYKARKNQTENKGITKLKI